MMTQKYMLRTLLEAALDIVYIIYIGYIDYISYIK